MQKKSKKYNFIFYYKKTLILKNPRKKKIKKK